MTKKSTRNKTLKNDKNGARTGGEKPRSGRVTRSVMTRSREKYLTDVL
jgi:hypothetical protein